MYKYTIFTVGEFTLAEEKWSTDMTTFENLSAKHRYEVEVIIRDYVVTTGGGYGARTIRDYITVDANNRTQAAAIATKNGYEVASVNMVG